MTDESKKAAVITAKLVADSGYESTIEARITAVQWGDICRIIEGTHKAVEFVTQG